jgi:hypothetical protein
MGKIIQGNMFYLEDNVIKIGSSYNILARNPKGGYA